MHHVTTEDSLHLFIVRPSLLPTLREKSNKILEHILKVSWEPCQTKQLTSGFHSRLAFLKEFCLQLLLTDVHGKPLKTGRGWWEGPSTHVCTHMHAHRCKVSYRFQEWR